MSVSNPQVAVQVDGSSVAMANASAADAQAFFFELQANGTYRLRSAADESLFLTADSLSYRGAVSARVADSSKAQNWILERQSDGTWHVLSAANTDFMLDTNGSTTAAGASCIMWANNNGATQKWTLEASDAQSTSVGEGGSGSGSSSGSEGGSEGSSGSEGGSAVTPDPDPDPDPAESSLPDSSDGTLYRIVNVANPNLCVQFNGSVARGTGAIVSTFSDTNRQYFSITRDGTTWVIRSAANDGVVLASASNTWRGAVQGAASGSSAGIWRIEETSDEGEFHILNGADSPWMLDVNGAYPLSGAACIMWRDNGGDTQVWTFEEVEGTGTGQGASGASEQVSLPAGFPSSADGTLYRIVSVSNPSVAVQANSDLANGGSVSMAAISDSSSQLFRFAFADDGTYTIESAAYDGMFLTPGSLMVNGDVFVMSTASGANRSWRLELSGSGRFHILSAANGELMLDTSGATTAAGARVIMWTNNNGNTQRWTLQAVEAPAAQTNPDPGASTDPGTSDEPGTSTDPGTSDEPVVTNLSLYRIVNVANPAVAVQISGSSPKTGASVAVAAKSTSATQLFTLGEAADGTVYLRSFYNPSLLLTANSLSVRGAVGVSASDDAKAQRWTLQKLSDGTYHIVSAANATYMLDTNGAYPNAGAACIMWFDNGGSTQKWKLETVDASTVTGALSRPVSDTTAYRIVSVSNPSVVVQAANDDPDAGAAANIAVPDGWANQAFTFELQPDGTYRIRCVANSDLLLTADTLSVRGSVSLRELSASRAQRWIIDVCADGTYHLLSADDPGFMLDTSGATTAAGAECIMWFDNGGSTQKWTFEKVDTESLSFAAPATPVTPVTPVEPADPVYVYQDMYDISIPDMIRYQKSNGWYNAATQANDLVYAVNPENFSPEDDRFYQFLRLDTGYSGVTAEELDAFIASTASGRSGKLAGMGYAFVKAAQTYGINEVYLLAHAIHESGWGTSTLAKGYAYDGSTKVLGEYYPAGTYYNFYGIGAVDSGPLSGGRALAVSQGWDSPEAAILGAAEWIADRYTFSSRNNSYMAQNTLYEMRWHSQFSDAYERRSGHQYATGTSWAYRIADIMAECYDSCDKTPLAAQYLIPVYSPAVHWRNADDWRDPDGYVMQWSELVTYSYDQIDELTDEELFIARTEMFYCHGYDYNGEDGALDDPELQAYFEAKTWPRELTGVEWSADELANLRTIEQLEAERGSEYAERGYHLSDI